MIVGAAEDGGAGADDADDAVASGADGGFGSGLDHAENGDGQGFPQGGNGECGGGVASDDDGFAGAVEEELADFLRVTGDGGLAFAAVGDARGVADVENVFMRELLAQGGDDGESADAGIENADGGGVGGRQIRVRGHGFRRKVAEWR